MKKDNKSLILYIIGILMLFVGLAVTTASTILIISHNIKSKEYKDTTAKVVAYDKKDNGLRAIIIEYSVNEKFYQITSNHYSKKPEKLDTEIKIKYNPKNHGEIIWVDNNRNGKYLASGIILLVGDIAIWFIINLKDKKKKGSLDDTKSLTPIPEAIKTEEIKEEEIENKPETESQTPADGTILIPIIPEEKVEEQKEEVKEEVVEEEKEEQVEEPKEEIPEPILVKEVTAEIPIVKEVGEPIGEPLFAKEKIPAIFTKEEEATEDNALDEFKKKKEEKLPVPELPEIESEMPKLNIPEIPYDMDSPRETVVSNVLETTVALPVLKKETIELPSKKENKSLKVNKNIKEDALSKLLDDIEKGN